MGIFTMPSLGADMEAGILVEWLKQQGEQVSHGDIIAVVETDKGAIEVEVFEDGTLAELLVKPGEKVPVGTPLAKIAEAGFAKAGFAGPESSVVAKPAPMEVPAAPADLPTAAARSEAEFSPAAMPATAVSVGASPAARLLAGETGVDLGSVTGTGPAGSIVRHDVEEAAKGRAAPDTGARDLDPMRRAIAAAMSRAKRDIPHYYLGHSFDVSAAIHWLDAHNAAHPPPDRLLMGALTLKAVALALRDFPEFNGFYGPDGFTPGSAIHVGTAIAMRGGGLAAPAIHHTDMLSLADLMVKMRDLIARVRKGGFRSSEISDPTVTVSSLGERGVDMLLPIIYPPQVAIIGFGSVTPRAWAVGDERGDAVAVRPVLYATLAADHRASDGHRGALLLRRIAELLNAPEVL